MTVTILNSNPRAISIYENGSLAYVLIKAHTKVSVSGSNIILRYVYNTRAITLTYLYSDVTDPSAASAAALAAIIETYLSGSSLAASSFKVKADALDPVPGFLDAKVDGITIVVNPVTHELEATGGGGYGGQTIYTGDGTLTGNRTVDGGGYALTLDNLGWVLIEADMGPIGLASSLGGISLMCNAGGDTIRLETSNVSGISATLAILEINRDDQNGQ